MNTFPRDCYHQFNFSSMLDECCSTFYYLLTRKDSIDVILLTVCKKNNCTKFPSLILALFRMDLFGAAHGWRCKKVLFPKVCHTYPIMMKLCTVIPYLKYTNHVIPASSSADISIFHQKSANFALSRNTDIDCILMPNFQLY